MLGSRALALSNKVLKNMLTFKQITFLLLMIIYMHNIIFLDWGQRALHVLELNHTGDKQRIYEEHFSLSFNLFLIVKDQQLLWLYFPNTFKAF